MHTRLAPTILLGLALGPLGLAGCGDDSGNSDDGNNGSSTGIAPATDTGTPGTDTNPGTTDPATDDGPPTTTEPPADTTAGEDDSTGPAGDCQVWEITYDLTGSVFEISDTEAGAGNQANTVEEPYDEDDNIGPGNFVLQFRDVDGAPGEFAYLHSYDVDVNFVVESFGLVITTDLVQGAGPEECGVSGGFLNEGVVAWAPPVIAGHRSMGTISCEDDGGPLINCDAGGFGGNNPMEIDETTDQPLNNFTFTEDLTAFQMPTVVVAMNDNPMSTAEWTYVGTEVSRELVDAPACLCE